jgi:hypothetical protein
VVIKNRCRKPSSEPCTTNTKTSSIDSRAA